MDLSALQTTNTSVKTLDYYRFPPFAMLLSHFVARIKNITCPFKGKEKGEVNVEAAVTSSLLPQPKHHGSVCGSESPPSHLILPGSSAISVRPPHHAPAQRHGGAGQPRRRHPPPRGDRGGGRGRLHAAGGRAKPRTRSLGGLLPPVAEADAFPRSQPNHPGQSEGLLRLQGEFGLAALSTGGSGWISIVVSVVMIPARYHRAGCERHQDRGPVLRGWRGAQCLAAGRVSDLSHRATRDLRRRH